MSKLKITIILLVLISVLLVIPSSFAQDNKTVMELAGNESDVLTNDYYFDANLENDTGDGSALNPYKDLNSNRIVNNSVIHLNNGIYSLRNPTVINNVTIIGQTTNKTIISDADFTVSTSMTLVNVTFLSSMNNYGNFTATNSVISSLNNYGSVTCYDSSLDNVYNNGMLSSLNCKIDGFYNYDKFLSKNDVFYKSYLNNYGDSTIIGGLFTSNPIYNNGNLKITNSVLSKSKVDNHGNLIAEGSIFANSSSTNGGAIISDNNMTFNNCTFENNHADYGGAIYINGEVVLNITDSLFKDNYANHYGGAISLEDTNATIKSTDFVNDYSLGDAGGAIYAKKSREIIIFYSNFKNCAATFGGAIASLNSHLNLTLVSAKSNAAKYDGGAVYFLYGLCTMIESTFDENTANNGGAVFIDECEIFNVFANNFTKNRANRTGGAVYSLYSDTFHNTILNDTLENSFSGNLAANENDVYEANSLNMEIGDGNYILIKFNPLYNGTLPARFDLRDYGYVTPVKDQGSGGNCWSFSSTAALESCILKATGKSYDLSEENMKNIMSLYSDYGWAMDTNIGGYDSMGVGYLTAWLGPVNESDDSYNPSSVLSPILHSFIHVQNIIYLNRANYTDNDAIKKAIMDYGAVSTSVYWSNAYIKNVKNYYYSGTSGANHAVTIVGWDDNYSKSNFNSKPKGDGAWIIKNSWGTSSGDKGFFYVSYYDTKLAPINKSKAIYTIILNDTIKLDKNYQYDIQGMSDYFYNTTDTVWYKNRFISTSDEYLAAVSTYFQKESSWDVSIYVNNVLKHVQSGFSTSSYKTINLEKLIPLKAGDIFEVVFKLKVNGDAGVPISESVSFNKNIYTNNISFISYDGKTWTDLYNLSWTYPDHSYTSQVACIKAFTILDKINTTIKLSVESNVNPAEITAKVTDQYGNIVTSGHVVFTVEGKKISVNVEKGIARLVYAFKNVEGNVINAMFSGDGYNNISTKISLSVVKTTLKANDVVSYYDDSIKYCATLTDATGKGVAQKEIMFKINGKKYIVSTDSKGQAIVELVLDVGNYTILCALNDNSSNSEVLSNKIIVKSTIVMPNHVNFAYNSKFTATIYDSEGNLLKNKDVSLLIDGTEHALMTDSNGKLSYTITLNPGTYEFAVFNLNVYEIKYQSIKVVKRITGNSALTMYYGAGKYYKVRVCDDDGKYVKGLKVSFKVNGKTYTKYTDANGYASIKIGLAPGTYTIKATYKGYSVSNKITVKPTLIMSAKTVKKSKTFKYTVKLLSSSGKILKYKKVTVKFRGKTYKVKTSSKGIATFKIKAYSKTGTFKLTASYGSAKISKKIKVKK